MKLKLGQGVVYPGHGVGIVEGIETKEILGNNQKFYRLKIMGSGMAIMVPVGSLEAIGVRRIASKAEAREALRILKKKSGVKFGETWNKRYREFMDQIKSGKLLEIAKVHAGIMQIRCEHELSFGERKMLDNAKYLLIQEIGMALGLEADDIEGLFAVAA